jgi:hypothetical protein
VNLAAGGAGHRGHGVAVDVEAESIVAGGDRDDLPGVDHADLDPLGGDHDLASLRYPALHRERPGGRGRSSCGPACAAQPVPFAWRNRARQGTQQCPVVADDRHLRAVHPQGDAFPGQLEADTDRRSCQSGQPGGVHHSLHLDRGAGRGREGGRPGRASAISGQPG